MALEFGQAGGVARSELMSALDFLLEVANIRLGFGDPRQRLVARLAQIIRQECGEEVAPMHDRLLADG
jgi:hypothetical protein